MASRNGLGPYCARASPRVRKFPKDFAIFSPSTLSIALCIQYRANECPDASDSARSFSWCGKVRSEPPPWISKSSPSRCNDIATHSMCHPGRPGPQGLSQVGSPGFAAFHRAKSKGSCLSSSEVTLACALSRSSFTVRPTRAP